MAHLAHKLGGWMPNDYSKDDWRED